MNSDVHQSEWFTPEIELIVNHNGKAGRVLSYRTERYHLQPRSDRIYEVKWADGSISILDSRKHDFEVKKSDTIPDKLTSPPPFQWELAIWEDFPLVGDHTIHPDRNWDKQKACKRVFDQHEYKPVVGVITNKFGWLFECHCTKRELVQIDLKFESMHRGHKTSDYEEADFAGEICYRYLEWEFSECGGAIDRIQSIRYCHDCQVIVNADIDSICRKCQSHDFVNMDDYEFYEWKKMVKEYVYDKLTVEVTV